MKAQLGFLFLFCSLSGFSQVDAIVGSATKSIIPQLVTNPIMESSAVSVANLNATMNATLLSIETDQKLINEAMKKVTWAKNLQTAQRLIVLLENVTCTARNLQVKMAYVSNNCLWDYQFEMQIVKISMAADYLGIVLSGASILSTGERMEGINNAIDKFEAAQSGLGSLSTLVNRQIRRQAQADKASRDIDEIFKKY